MVLVLLLVTSAVAAVAVAVWPAEVAGPSFAERALAAVGQEPVLHVVFRDPWGRTLIDLESGDRRVMHAEREVWFDPRRGYRSVERFGGVVQYDATFAQGDVQPEANELYREFASGYREALASGRARVLGEEEVGGEPVTWVRVGSRRGPDDPRTRGPDVYATDVAVSGETFVPVYLRYTQNDRPALRSLTKVLKVETLPRRAVRFGRTSGTDGLGFSGGYGPLLTAREARTLLGRRPLWAGQRLVGLPYVATRTFVQGVGPFRGSTPSRRVESVTVGYGTPKDEADTLWVANRRRHVLIHQLRSADDVYPFDVPVRGYLPPEGSVLSVGGGNGIVRSHGLAVVIDAPNEETLIAAARALRPLGT